MVDELMRRIAALESRDADREARIRMLEQGNIPADVLNFGSGRKGRVRINFLTDAHPVLELATAPAIEVDRSGLTPTRAFRLLLDGETDQLGGVWIRRGDGRVVTLTATSATTWTIDVDGEAVPFVPGTLKLWLRRQTFIAAEAPGSTAGTGIVFALDGDGITLTADQDLGDNPIFLEGKVSQV